MPALTCWEAGTTGEQLGLSRDSSPCPFLSPNSHCCHLGLSMTPLTCMLCPLSPLPMLFTGLLCAVAAWVV